MIQPSSETCPDCGRLMQIEAGEVFCRICDLDQIEAKLCEEDDGFRGGLVTYERIVATKMLRGSAPPVIEHNGREFALQAAPENRTAVYLARA